MKRVPARSTPLAYFLTFTCYGTRLHGSEQGSVDRHHITYGMPGLLPDSLRRSVERARMKCPAYAMDAWRRATVMEATVGACSHRGWFLRAVHGRTTHVHIIASAPTAPERILNDIKAYATRALNLAGMDGMNQKRWAKHGSTKYLWTLKQLEGALHYVVHEQGQPMALYVAPNAYEI